MADATILKKIYEYCNIPGIEVVSLTVTDGETYVSKKFKTILGVVPGSNYDVDAHLNATHSGNTVTVNWNGQTDKNCTLIIFGKK